MQIELTKVEIEHLLMLLRDAEMDGNYYGNKRQYLARAKRIETALEGVKVETK